MGTSGLKRRLGWRHAGRVAHFDHLDAASRVRFAMYAWGGAGLLGLCLVLFGGLSHIDRLPLLAITGISIAVALTYLIGFDRLPRWTYTASTSLAIVVIAAVLYFTHRPTSALVALYVPMLVSFFYFHEGRMWGAFQNALIGVTYGAVLALERPEGAIAWWFLVFGIFLLADHLMGQARGRIERLVLELKKAARTDPLTGLLNRRAFKQEFDLELERSRRAARPMTLMMADIDHFKLVNDKLGHAAGDEALKQMAQLLRSEARRVDIAVRMGGEEFALLLPGTDEAGAYILAERVRAAGRRWFEDQEVRLTISFGIASYPAHGCDTEMLMRAADRALYAAKTLGRDRTVICNRPVTVEADNHLAPRGGRAAV